MAHLPNITSLTIPESITAITSDSFTDCPQLATITVAPNNPTYASIDGLLYNKALTRVLLCPESAEGVVSLPDQTDAVPASALSHCANLSTLLVGQDNVVYTSINGSLYSKDASTLIACPGGIGQTLTLPKQSTTIGPDALAGITTLKSIVVLGNITAIDPTAFNDQAKQSTTIALPGGEDYEARKQVWQQAGFKNFATPANPGDTQTPDQPSNPGDKPDNPTDPSKPASGFTYKLLEDYTLEASWTGELSPASNPIIPTTAQLAGLSYTVSTLAPKAFAGTALTAIDIPTSITTIGDQAFANCPNLTRIVTHTNTIQIAPTALEACTNLELWCPYNEAETYPWSIGLFATNNHIKAYGLPASQQALTLEVGQSANLFEPGTLQAPDPSKAVYAYEATCLSVSQEGTITAKAPGTTTITTTLELEEIPLTHTTRTISVTTPTTPITPEQPETSTPTLPIAQPITPRYPPNLATPTQASAPLYARGGTQPNVPVPDVKVTVPTAAPFSIDAAGNVTSKADTLTITSTDTSIIAEPIRVTEITFDHGKDSQRLLPNQADRENTTVSVAENPAKPEDPKVSKKLPLIPKPSDPPAPPNPPTSWKPDNPKSAPFRVETSTPLSITFGFKLPENAALSYVSDSDPKPVSLAKVEFTYALLAPIATSLTLTSDKAIATPKVGDTLTAAPPSGEAASIPNPIYTWYELANTGETPTKVLQRTSSNTYKLLEGQNTKFICCALSDGKIDKPKDTSWTSRPVYSDLTAQVAPADPPPLPDYATLEAYSWEELDQVAKYLSDHRNDANNTVYNALYNKFDGFMRQGIGNVPTAGAKKSLGIGSLNVRIIGINHDNKAGGGKAGLTFMTDYAVPDCNSVMNPTATNSGGWEASYMRNTTMKSAKPAEEGGSVWEAFKNAKPADNPTPYIKEVLKDNAKGISPTTDKLFLLSNQEIIGSNWISGEGTQYPFFAGASLKDQNAANINPILQFGNGWWERSSYPNNSGIFVYCSANGYPSNSNSANRTYGVAPGFSL